ncbi:MAG TPA: sigma factor-like helix-turn-helix DNA-binding protein [Acidimicrobiales bacterium]|nr:sigma factor-like helix-turn-helix DNA-binding protein [Acidimicrobiales bacterium]
MAGEADFDGWYRDQYSRVVALLYVVTGDVPAAEAAAAETFVRAFERWERVRTMESGRWLYSTALACAGREDRWRRLPWRSRPDADAPPAAPPAIFAPEVWDAVRRLTREERTVVALRYVLDLPEAEVGLVMGLPRGAASSLLAVARRNVAVLATPPAPEEPVDHPDELPEPPRPQNLPL